MTEQSAEQPLPGNVAWLTIADDAVDAVHRVRTGPLGLQILPLTPGSPPPAFHGARLRGTRCVWSACTVSGTRLTRAGQPVGSACPEPAVQLLARVAAEGSVFDAPGSTAAFGGELLVLDMSCEVNEEFDANTHVFTLKVPIAAAGLEPATVATMIGGSFELTELQLALLRGAAGLFGTARDELTTTARLLGVDRYLGALAGLVLRTAVERSATEPGHGESVRARVDAIITAQAADPVLTPAAIAQQLNISLRRLYRAFNGAESPAARIRRRRLELAAELLASAPRRAQVEAVAQECGFQSPQYFSRAFRREFGLSPRAYRSAHREPASSD